ncbi:DedA family protein [Asaia lannensis]|uniref:DedA family protein n=1 Tax=Asaia lannensis TaxID=415421 RepID=UPI0021BD6ED9
MRALLHLLEHLLKEYGYGIIGVVVMLESMGLPLPAESLIIGASLYAATTHHLEIRWIVVAAVTGAIMGDNFGYLIGRSIGYKLLQKHGAKVGLTKERLLLGRFLFKRHGGLVVFVGRFVAVLRVFIALLAGANHMPWKSFLWHNALGGVFWAGGYAVATYFLGKEIFSLSGPLAIGLGSIVVVGLGVALYFLKKNEKRLTEEALKEAEAEEHSGKAAS